MAGVTLARIGRRSAAPSGTNSLQNRARRIRWFPVVTFALATFAFMPKALLGLGVFGPFDILQLASPWRDVLAATPHVSTRVQNDLVQSVPVLAAIINAVRHGHWLIWTPYIGAGEPIGALPLSGVQSPFNLPLVVLPEAWGLGVVVAMRLLFSQAFFYLFLRRLKLSVPISTFGAVAYTFCGTNVVLLGRINAYLILPALLWAVVRVLDRRGPLDVVLLALAAALAWLEGFPGGFVNTVAIACLLALFLVLPMAAGDGGPPAIARRLLAGAAMVGCGLALAAGLVGFSVLPFERISADSGLVSQRHYTAVDHLPSAVMPAILSVGALGNLHREELMPSVAANGSIAGAGNAVELESGAGLVVVLTAVAGMVLVLLGSVRFTRSQAALYLFGLVSVVGGILLVYFNTPLLTLFYDLPLLGVSSANRFRIIINIGFVILACLGLEGFLTARRSSRHDPTPGSDHGGRVSWGLRISVALAALALILTLRYAWKGYGAWLGTALAANVRREIALEAVGSLIVSIAAYYFLHRAARTGRQALLVACVAGTLTIATFATVPFPIRTFTPTVSPNLLYPQTPGHAELRQLAGRQYRILGSGLGTFYSNSSVTYHYLDLRGLSLSDPSFRRLVKSALPNAYSLDAFKVIYDPTLGDPFHFDSPALNDLAVRYYVAGTDEVPFANNLGSKPPVATRALTSAVSLARTVRAHSRLTGFAIPVERAGQCNGSRLVTRATAGGKVLGTSERPAVDAPEGIPGFLAFPIPEGGARTGSLVRVTIGIAGHMCPLAAGTDRTGQLTLSQLIEPAAGPAIVADDDAVFYERPQAHSIVWMTGGWQWVQSAATALTLATASTRRAGDPVPAASTLTPEPGAAAGQVQQVSYVSNGFDVRVSTTGRNLLATGFAGTSRNWSVDVDGRRSHLAAVDGALLGAVVGPGTHTVSFRYTVPDFALGAGISAVSLLALVALVVADRRRRSV